MDGWMDGWIDRWMDGWMGGWMDGWIYGLLQTWVQIPALPGTSSLTLVKLFKVSGPLFPGV